MHFWENAPEIILHMFQNVHLSLLLCINCKLTSMPSLCAQASHGLLETPLSAHSKRVTLQQLLRLWMIAKLVFYVHWNCHQWIIHGFKFKVSKYSDCVRPFLSKWLFPVQTMHLMRCEVCSLITTKKRKSLMGSSNKRFRFISVL